ncbi:hypothetical protein [Mesorhizobium intechi]|uniref:hypothetical protein n=1 Tax=Mesorhizobium intechi TaxID=537601 RepID=UPI001FE89D5E|nr:hypothetical protein [Mesorhizobium intechi]
MMLRLIASMPSLPAGHATRAMPLALSADTLKGAIRLSFSAYRLSLPISARLSTRNHDQKIA